MTHHEAQRLLGALALEDLDTAERREALAHVSVCEQCRHEIADMRAAFALVQEAVDAMSTVSSEEPLPLGVPVASPAGPSTRSFPFFSLRLIPASDRAALAATAALLAVVGLLSAVGLVRSAGLHLSAPGAQATAADTVEFVQLAEAETDAVFYDSGPDRKPEDVAYSSTDGVAPVVSSHYWYDDGSKRSGAQPEAEDRTSTEALAAVVADPQVRELDDLVDADFESVVTHFSDVNVSGPGATAGGIVSFAKESGTAEWGGFAGGGGGMAEGEEESAVEENYFVLGDRPAIVADAERHADVPGERPGNGEALFGAILSGNGRADPLRRGGVAGEAPDTNTDGTVDLFGDLVFQDDMRPVTNADESAIASSLVRHRFHEEQTKGTGPARLPETKPGPARPDAVRGPSPTAEPVSGEGGMLGLGTDGGGRRELESRDRLLGRDNEINKALREDEGKKKAQKPAPTLSPVKKNALPVLEKVLEETQEYVDDDFAVELPPPPKTPPPPVNPFVLTARDPLSTFSLEADTASYTLTRRYIHGGYRPPRGIVRMEEFVNAFDYNYPGQAERTFAVHAEAAPTPFEPGLVLLKVGVKGKVLGRDGRKPAHLVFVIDASGSMAREDRMPLVRHALNLLVGQLGSTDRVTLVTFGTQPRLFLEAVTASDRAGIGRAVDTIECGASTNILAGIELGYQLAARHFRAGEINRVILCSDGVANVGPNDAEALLAKVDRFRRQGVTFTSVGVGAGSYDDTMLEQLANKGDGNYVFIDSPSEAQRVFVDEMAATLQTIAKDVKIQVEFNPERVRRYRLIGYENRAVADRDFRDDAVDAGEIGSGQSGTALYELELSGRRERHHEDLGTVYVRYKDVDGGGVEEIATRLSGGLIARRTPETDPRFFLGACAAEFAEILRGSEHVRNRSLADLEQLAVRVANTLPLDKHVQELLMLIRKADGLPEMK